MNTFLPFADFTKSAQALDMKRLGKQRLEAWQIACAYLQPNAPYTNHPAARMWEDYLPALMLYGQAICKEWIKRGYEDSYLKVFNGILWSFRMQDMPEPMPPWLGDEELHARYRAALIAKKPEFYIPLFETTPTPQDYIDEFKEAIENETPLPYKWPV